MEALDTRLKAAILKDWVRPHGRDGFERRWRPLATVRHGLPRCGARYHTRGRPDAKPSYTVKGGGSQPKKHVSLSRTLYLMHIGYYYLQGSS